MYYNYKVAIKEDIRRWIEDDDGYRFNLVNYKHKFDHFKDTVTREICDALYSCMITCDRVTGDKSGYDLA